MIGWVGQVTLIIRGEPLKTMAQQDNYPEASWQSVVFLVLSAICDHKPKTLRGGY